MEQFYLKGRPGPREWCSEKVDFKSYFGKYSKTLNSYGPNFNLKLSEIDILQYFVPQSNQLSKEQLDKLIDITNVARLFKLNYNDMEKKADSKVEPVPSTSRSPHQDPKDSEACRKMQNRTSSSTHEEAKDSVELFKKIQNRLLPEQSSSFGKEVIVDPTENGGRKNLVPNKDYIVSFRIHEPFRQRHARSKSLRPGQSIQQIWLLGYQTLSNLKDKILCEADYQDIRGDISECPDVPIDKRAKDVYRSSMFYIDNKFYIDEREISNFDYSEPIREWGKARGMEFGETLSMERANICDLEVRMGYPYLYVHQGSCEHLVIINDAKLLTTNDSLYSRDYPLVSRIIKRNLNYCMTCSRFPARWIVRDCDRLAHNPTFQCKDCFRLFHYVNGKKVGKFKAYLYVQRGTIV